MKDITWKQKVIRIEHTNYFNTLKSQTDPIEKIDAFTHFFQHWKWNAFSLILLYFSCFSFTISENATKSKFWQKTLNILSALTFTGSHFAFYDWKVSFSPISPIIFSLGETVKNNFATFSLIGENSWMGYRTLVFEGFWYQNRLFSIFSWKKKVSVEEKLDLKSQQCFSSATKRF